MYDFTACIVTYNTERDELKKIIECFQKVELRFKLWISDNSEKDDLKEFIEKFSDDRIEYIFNNSNDGFGSGHNVVVKKLLEDGIKSEFHLMVNADVVFEKNTIENQDVVCMRCVVKLRWLDIKKFLIPLQNRMVPWPSG